MWHCKFRFFEILKKISSFILFWNRGVVLVTMITLSCCGNMARKTPHNYICLFLFTLAQSFLVGVIASMYQVQIVIYAVLITGVICLGLTLFAFQTKIDFTVFNGMMFIIFLVFMMFGFIKIFFPHNNTMHLIYSCIGALLFSAVSNILIFIIFLFFVFVLLWLFIKLSEIRKAVAKHGIFFFCQSMITNPSYFI